MPENVLQKLWNEEKARPPLVLLGLIVALSGIWLIFGGSREEPKSVPVEEYREVVVRGKVEVRDAYESLDSSRPMNVHLAIPELAYQRDAVLTQDSDGAFEISLKLPAGKEQYSFDLELSQGDTRWRIRSDQKIQTAESSLDLAELEAEPPAEEKTNPRAHLGRKATHDPETRRELREERRRQRAKRKEQKLQRRGRTKKR